MNKLIQQQQKKEEEKRWGKEIDRIWIGRIWVQGLGWLTFWPKHSFLIAIQICGGGGDDYFMNLKSDLTTSYRYVNDYNAAADVNKRHLLLHGCMKYFWHLKPEKNENFSIYFEDFYKWIDSWVFIDFKVL